MPVQRVSVEAMRQAGTWLDVGELFRVIDLHLEELDMSARDAPAARALHDGLLACVAVRHHPPNRPGCLAKLLVPGATVPCGACTAPGCPGNHFEGSVAVLVHHKTQAHRGPIKLNIQEGSVTSKLLHLYLDWARPLLVAVEGDPFLFLNTKGRGMSDSGLAEYLPRVLHSWGAGQLGCSKLRHIVATGLLDFASPEAVAGAQRAGMLARIASNLSLP
jgi:hypothetical protein